MVDDFVLNAKWQRVRWLYAAHRVQAALTRLIENLKYRPDQPRDEFGRWVDDLTGPRYGPGDDRTQLTQNIPRGGRGGGRAARWPDATPGQLTRLALAEARADSVVRRVRELDPTWRPEPTMSEGVEGEISALEAQAWQAQTRLAELSRQPSEWLINAYRTSHSQQDLFGRETWPRDRGTVAVTTINGMPIIGVNSRAPGYTSEDRRAAEAMRDVLISKYPNVMETSDIGQRPNDALFHAEATALIRGTRDARGTLVGQSIVVNVDRSMCRSCQDVLPSLGLELGNPTATFVGPSGIIRTMENGMWR